MSSFLFNVYFQYSYDTLCNAHHLPRQMLQSQGKDVKVFVQYFQSCTVKCKATTLPL